MESTFFAREQQGGTRLEENSTYHLPQRGWIRTLNKIIRYKAKKGDTILVHNEQQREYVQLAVDNKASHLELTVMIAKDNDEDEDLVLQ